MTTETEDGKWELKNEMGELFFIHGWKWLGRRLRLAASLAASWVRRGWFKISVVLLLAWIGWNLDSVVFTSGRYAKVRVPYADNPQQSLDGIEGQINDIQYKLRAIESELIFIKDNTRD